MIFHGSFLENAPWTCVWRDDERKKNGRVKNAIIQSIFKKSYLNISPVTFKRIITCIPGGKFCSAVHVLNGNICFIDREK